jgi:hypothetical protein
MHYDNYNSDDINEYNSQYNSGFEASTDQVAFVDYEGDGLWAFGILEMDATGKPQIRETIDRDSDLNKLVKRAVMDWGVDPTELLVSSCGREIALLALKGKKIGE